jgi:hypothetical protein
MATLPPVTQSSYGAAAAAATAAQPHQDEAAYAEYLHRNTLHGFRPCVRPGDPSKVYICVGSLLSRGADITNVNVGACLLAIVHLLQTTAEIYDDDDDYCDYQITTATDDVDGLTAPTLVVAFAQRALVPLLVDCLTDCCVVQLATLLRPIYTGTVGFSIEASERIGLRRLERLSATMEATRGLVVSWPLVQPACWATEAGREFSSRLLARASFIRPSVGTTTRGALLHVEGVDYPPPDDYLDALVNNKY